MASQPITSQGKPHAHPPTILTGLVLSTGAAFTSKLRALGLYAAILGFTSEYRHAARV